ncbi:MAG: sigma-54 dependent transcriptional regulator [Bacteroidota bacterium]|nr:sigma-54 dependent transcriptional regulator [Bacteroidota bacterium]MDP4233303.1 sigma-54 dependent transcriptional regulator [Bacteroidota bacterium]MDP4242077.1 sigma-54 dependent transcriptional regulator [Bacteroidota bacterium]MDP4288645.1 sigma-54 dependent transcriptional regulator [Bacteroidota bacterium]
MASILFVDDELSTRDNYRTILEHYGHQVTLASNVQEGVNLLSSNGVFDLVITDMRMGSESGLDMLRQARTLAPETEVIVLTGHAQLENAVEAMKLGAADYLTKETDYKEIMLVVEKALEKRTLKQEIERLRKRVGNEFSFRKIVGQSPAILQLQDTLRRVAPTTSRVLITGESGTGKELIAETIHTNSPRKDAPFIAINCGAIPRDLLESELFGYVRGAFTGADRDKTGLLASADRGTVFLDEVGEMSLETQVKLLRFLEQGEIAPVGSTKTRIVDVRVIAATNRDLAEAVRTHSFREDLYYRLKVISVHLPPLRERKQDIPLLAEALLRELAMKAGRKVYRISADAMRGLADYDWPGNVRELKNVIERALIFADGDQIELEHLPEELFLHPAIASGQLENGVVPLDEVEKKYILDLLERNGGNKLQTAKQLNIATTTLYRKLRMYGIE